MSLAQKLSKYINPNPEFKDPEDSHDDVTSAKIVDNFAEEYDDKLEQGSIRIAAFAEDLDERYSGKKTSRKKLKEELGDVSDDEEPLSDEGIEDDGSQSESSDEEEEDSEIGEDESDDEMDSSGRNEDQMPNQDSLMVDEDEGDDMQTFSAVDVAREKEQADAIKAQTGLYGELLECRIKLQKVLQLSNKLPQVDTYDTFHPKCAADYIQVQDSLLEFLNDLAHIQTTLLTRNRHTRHIVTGEPEAPDSDDENEIPSDDDEVDSEAEGVSEPAVKRVKLDLDSAAQLLTERHDRFTSYRNNSIISWHEKTNVMKTGDKSFSSFDQSILEYINRILSDEERLIKRTQLQRTSYRVLGKPVTTSEGATEGVDEDVIQEAPKKANQLVNYDEEIFDDDDFYQHLLREMIERCTQDTSANTSLSRRWLQIQQLRSSLKKKVDSSFNKDKKIKYLVHPQLVNFMAPVNKDTISDETKTELFNSLFGNLQNKN